SIIGALVTANGPAQFATTVMSAIAAAAAGASSTSKTLMGKPFGRQLLDRPGTPTGQHRIETTSPGLHGYKMPRIAVGAVNHPLCAAGHTHLICFALRADSAA